ncbi:MAG: hypothetical protein ACRYFS_18720 [Janthinobacterium lividum]
MSKPKMHEVKFTEVISKLISWREEALSDLRTPETHAAGLILKRQLDDAIAQLELCQRFQIRPSEKITILPNLRTMSPSSSYRLIEDNETDNPKYWIEFKVDGEYFRLMPGDIIIEQS